MEFDDRQNHQGEPIIPPDDPPGIVESSHTNSSLGRGSDNGINNATNCPARDLAELSSSERFKVLLMWQWLHDPDAAGDT